MSRKAWTVEEAMRVEEMVAQGRSMASIARALGRSRVSVEVWCKRNVKRSKMRPLSARQAAVMLGVPCSKVIAWWIEQGWLRGRKSMVGAGKSRRWMVDEHALLDFLRAPEHWHRWEVERITDAGLREWAEEVRSERYMTQAEVARRYSVATGTVAAWLDRGVLPYADTGSHRMIPASALADFRPPYELDRHGKRRIPFTSAEDARLLALRATGASWQECAYQLRRAVGSCAGRWHRLQARPRVIDIAEAAG